MPDRPDINDPRRNQWELEQQQKALEETAEGRKRKPSRLEKAIMDAGDRVAEVLSERLSEMLEKQLSAQGASTLGSVEASTPTQADLPPVDAPAAQPTSMPEAPPVAAEAEFGSLTDVAPSAAEPPEMTQFDVASFEPVQLDAPLETARGSEFELGDVDLGAAVADLGNAVEDVPMPASMAAELPPVPDTHETMQQVTLLNMQQGMTPDAVAEFKIPDMAGLPEESSPALDPPELQSSETVQLGQLDFDTGPTPEPGLQTIDVGGQVNEAALDVPEADTTAPLEPMGSLESELAMPTPQELAQEVGSWQDAPPPHRDAVRPARLQGKPLPEMPGHAAAGVTEPLMATSYDPRSVGRGGTPPQLPDPSAVTDTPPVAPTEVPSTRGSIESVEGLADANDALDEFSDAIREWSSNLTDSFQELAESFRQLAADVDREGDER